jgi:selenide,water dikinase
MATSSGDAARILAPHATAMTDVTGFGLAGHLWNICEASGVAARLDQASVPVLPGATALLATGLRSTIHGANEAAVLGALNGLADPILFDPQTSGGLLAAVPADKANQLMRDFQGIGVPVTEIGEITEGSSRIDIA